MKRCTIEHLNFTR